MKKIMGAVLAAAMLAGTVTAADVSFSYKGSNYFRLKGSNLDYMAGSASLKEDKTGTKSTNATLKGTGNGSYAANKYYNYSRDDYMRADCLSVGLTTDVAGIVLDFDTKEGDIVADEYYGWMNFGLPLGSLQLTVGSWNGRFVNRVLADKNDLDSEEFELYKPGVINGMAGKDSDNLTLGKLGLVGAWTLADVLPGTLMVKLGLARYYDSDWNKNGGFKWSANDDANGTTGSDTTAWAWNPDYDTFKVKAGFLAEVAYRQEGAFAANLAVRALNKHSYSFGAWVSPELADTVQMTVGGTFATLKVWNKNANPKTKGTETDPDTGYATAGVLNYGANGGWSDRKYEYGVDFRLRLQVTDDLSLTTMNNLSSGYNVKDDENHGQLWNMLNATYRMADNLKASFTVQSDAVLFCPVPHNQNREWDLYLTPSLIIDASERVRVSTSMRAYLPDIHNFAIRNIVLTVPVIFSFHY